MRRFDHADYYISDDGSYCWSPLASPATSSNCRLAWTPSPFLRFLGLGIGVMNCDERRV